MGNLKVQSSSLSVPSSSVGQAPSAQANKKNNDVLTSLSSDKKETKKSCSCFKWVGDLFSSFWKWLTSFCRKSSQPEQKKAEDNKKPAQSEVVPNKKADFQLRDFMLKAEEEVLKNVKCHPSLLSRDKDGKVSKYLLMRNYGNDLRSVTICLNGEVILQMDNLNIIMTKKNERGVQEMIVEKMKGALKGKAIDENSKITIKSVSFDNDEIDPSFASPSDMNGNVKVTAPSKETASKLPADFLKAAKEQVQKEVQYQPKSNRLDSVTILLNGKVFLEMDKLELKQKSDETKVQEAIIGKMIKALEGREIDDKSRITVLAYWL